MEFAAVLAVGVLHANTVFIGPLDDEHGQVLHPDLIHPVTKDELVLVAHRDHPLAHVQHPGPADFTAHRYLGRGPQWSAERNVREMLGDAYDAVDTLNLGHPEYVRAATLAGLGFAALSKRAVAADISAGFLKRLPVAPVARSITAVRRHGRGGPAQESFWEMLTGGRALVSGKMPSDGRGKS